ncbi:GroES-like protein [Delitschia confertaspora ATCC 74209]|uniref:GroES-like protein n=1 Tax=Delitschia confertaspora ATCC 74209 TaxID=1513339 RepID=A0A9P4JI32_9PLEO|nr:GroES-like protein [Delitschia confertaspora ATCC 74209]
MKALTYQGANKPPSLNDVPHPQITSATSAIVKLTYTTICGTDTHILSGAIPSIPSGRILGHEGVGEVAETGPGVTRFKKGDQVLISCITSCGTCISCKQGMPSHCETGGWILGNEVDGTQAEYVECRHADGSLYHIPEAMKQVERMKKLVMLSDIFPTGFECGVLNSKIRPGDTVAIVGAGPVGLAALITAQFYALKGVFVVDFDQNRLEVARGFGATHTCTPEEVEEVVRKETGGRMCDAVIEAVGADKSFESCQGLLAVGGRLANVGVHGGRARLRLEELWDRNVSITTRLVDATTTTQLMSLLQANKLPAEKLITHEYPFKDLEKAYQVFGQAAKEKALKVLIKMG